MAEKLLTIREVACILCLTEKDVIDLAEDGKIPAYKVGGVYLRFKKEQVEEFRKTLKNGRRPARSTFGEAIGDFFYFNDFYLVSTLVILALIYIVLFT